MLVSVRLSVFVLSLVSMALSARAQCELELQELQPVGGRPGDTFGYRVERSGNIAIIASTFADELGVDSGYATVWERDGAGTWKLARKLVPSNGAAGDFFSYSVAVDGTNVLVGAPGQDQAASQGGAVYVFARDRGGAGQWGELAHFAPAAVHAGAQFGYSLAVRGDHLLVGSPHYGTGLQGKAYLYQRNPAAPSGWSLELEFSSSDPATGFQFGQDVTLGDDVLAVSGAAHDLLPYDDTYIVHLRARDAGGPGNWGEVQRLFSPSGSRDFFAWEIGLEGDQLIAVAPGEWNPRTNEVGALYAFRRDLGGPENWGLERRIATQGAGAAAAEVDLRGDWIVSGNEQAVTVFGRNVGGPGAWGVVTEITDDPESLFGVDVALEGSELFVGASGGYGSSHVGEVYVYDLARLARVTWRNDALGANPDVYRAQSRPILGEPFEAEVDLRGTPYDHVLLATFARPLEVPLPGGQVLLGGRWVGATLATRGPFGRARFSLRVPATHALCGATFTTQAVLLGGGSFTLSNAQDVVLGVR
jgi:hypothetical protein